MNDDDLLSAPPPVPRRSRSRSKEEGVVGRVDTIEDIKIKNINERVVNKARLMTEIFFCKMKRFCLFKENFFAESNFN